MGFNSYLFLAFFALLLGLHHLPLGWRWRKGQLLMASYLFYAAWNPPFVLLILLSTLVDWWVVKGLVRGPGRAWRRLLLLISLGVNLGLLGFFKYSGFLLENFHALTALVGLEVDLAAPSIILPVGISFYTFQTLSYTLDVYAGRARPWPSFLDFALFVTFFPQLVAGPIVRAVDFLPQCQRPPAPDPARLSWGLCLMALGLFQKLVVADGIMAPLSDKVFAAPGLVGAGTAWLGVTAFSIRIFCDFAGYSTCAIGVAHTLGFTLPVNFRFPYGAVGFSDFWRRWHISLSTWLRDYLYIPLGGNRSGSWRTGRNLVITMLLGGLWHGASWTFVLWGALHGLYLALERGLVRLFPRPSPRGEALLRWPLGLLTYGLVCLAWVFFRARDTEGMGAVAGALALIGAMFGAGPEAPAALLGGVEAGLALTVVVIAYALHHLLRGRSLEELACLTPWWVRGVVVGLCLFAIVTMAGEDRAFIYFQF